MSLSSTINGPANFKSRDVKKCRQGFFLSICKSFVTDFLLVFVSFFSNKKQNRGAVMFYNYQKVIVCMLLLPVALNIVLPLVMLAVWLLKQLVMGKRRRGEAVHSGQESPIPLATS
jgi:hypothetical protein